MVTAILLNTVIWRDPAWDLAVVYNRDLANDLAVPADKASALRPPARKVARFAVAPVPFASSDGSVGPGLIGVLRF
jgi:hypothetical protein